MLNFKLVLSITSKFKLNTGVKKKKNKLNNYCKIKGNFTVYGQCNEYRNSITDYNFSEDQLGFTNLRRLKSLDQAVPQ